MSEKSASTQAPIFITGRFRSGTSFFWQIFNQLDGFCAWYEPLHPQLLSAISHVEPKDDHVGIDDYWGNYRTKPEFSKTYTNRFATQQLYMETGDEYPELEAYIKHLTEISKPDTPVLQFNRMDFRLGWLKAKFPQAKIIHIERNPVQLYHSQRKHIPKTERHDAMYWDAYELMPWCHALQADFPILLAEKQHHAFYHFYMLFRLSKIMANQHADVSINLDEQVFESYDFVDEINKVVVLSQDQKDQMKSLVNVPEQALSNKVTVENLSSIMTEVDMLLTASGLIDLFSEIPLRDIKSNYDEFWSKYGDINTSSAQLLLNINQLSSEMTRILAENNRLKSQLGVLQNKLHNLSDNDSENIINKVGDHE